MGDWFGHCEYDCFHNQSYYNIYKIKKSLNRLIVCVCLCTYRSRSKMTGSGTVNMTVFITSLAIYIFFLIKSLK